jgi:Na+/melibiose symporter-like transporter
MKLANLFKILAVISFLICLFGFMLVCSGDLHSDTMILIVGYSAMFAFSVMIAFIACAVNIEERIQREKDAQRHHAEYVRYMQWLQSQTKGMEA